MGAVKFAVSFPSELAREVRTLARREGGGVSAWLAEAARRRLRRQAARKALAEFESAHGAITDAELEAVRKRWPA